MGVHYFYNIMLLMCDTFFFFSNLFLTEDYIPLYILSNCAVLKNETVSIQLIVTS